MLDFGIGFDMKLFLYSLRTHENLVTDVKIELLTFNFLS